MFMYRREEPLTIAKAGSDVIKANVVVTLIASVWVFLRLCSRRMRKVEFQLEDYMILGALFFLYATLVSMTLAVVEGGYGHHTKDLSPDQIERTLKYTLTTQFWYACALGLVKCSICRMIGRVFIIRPFQIAAYITMGFCVAWAIMTCLIGLLICQPLAMNWNPLTPGGHCGNENIAFAVVGVIDLLTDLTIMIIPLPLIGALQVPFANKMGLLLIFLLGTLTMAMGAVRMSGIFTIDFSDFTYAATQTSIWSVSEIGTAIVVASSPMIRPIFDKIFHSLSSSIRSTRNGPYDQSHTKPADNGTGFGQLTDELPLTHMERQGVVTHRVQVVANPADSENSLDEYHAYNQASSRGYYEEENKIYVKVDTRVQSSERIGD